MSKRMWLSLRGSVLVALFIGIAVMAGLNAAHGVAIGRYLDALMWGLIAIPFMGGAVMVWTDDTMWR